MKIKFDYLLQLGRALMLPIALLPIAGILLRFGQPDLLNIKYVADAGNAIFNNLPFLFALGVAIGFAKDNNGAAALASAVGFLIMTSILNNINKSIDTGVLGGILIGLIAAALYNKFKDIKLPEFLAFFGGKRFVPIITGITAVLIGIVLGFIWPPIQDSLKVFSVWLLKSGGVGLFIYGTLNRLLLVAGLHHVINNLVWFVFGDYQGVNGVIVHGDIARFMAGDKSAGFFMAGWFPIMMFGLPGACLAMYKNAFKVNKPIVGGLLLSMALTAIVTGVTEPIEYAFIFLAPILFAIHAILSGISLVIMYSLNVHLGFTFSAGLVDYLLFFKQGTNPIYMLPVGLLFFLLYYFIFDFFIRKYNLPTIGRDMSKNEININKNAPRGKQFIEALGGYKNIVSVDSCVSRLRLIVKNSSIIDKDKLTKLGALGVVVIANDNMQVIVGTSADIIASEIRDCIDIKIVENQKLKIISKINLDKESITDYDYKLALDIIKVLGGIKNIDSINLLALTRIRVVLNEGIIIIDHDIIKNTFIKIININNLIKHVYVGEKAGVIFTAINKTLRKI